MIAFLIAAGALIALGLLILVPVLVQRGGQPADGDAALLADYRARIAELERDHARGAISASALAESRAAIEREMLANLPAGSGRLASGPPRVSAPGTSARNVLLAGIVAVPLVAVGVYSAIGRPDLVVSPPAQRMAESDQRRFAGMEPAERVDALEPWLERHPRAGEGWMLLGHAWRSLARHDAADEAYTRARELLGDDPALLAYHAESLLLANDRRFSPRINRLLERALERNPDQGLALLLMGHSLMMRDRPEEAARLWQRMAEQLPAGSERRAIVDSLIARTRAEGSPDGAATGDGGTTATDTRDGADGRVVARVSLAEDLAGAANGDDVVYVFARSSADGTMPLAVRRTRVANLPAEVVLTDDDSIMAGNTLSAADSVIIGARVARGGSVEPRPGDLEGFSEAVEPGSDTPAEVRIDTRIE